jgi:hypothetical protein
MDELNKYSLYEFINLDDEEREMYKAFGLRLKSNSFDSPSDILDWQWAVIKRLQDILNKSILHYDDMIEVLLIATENSKETILNTSWINSFQLYNFVVSGLERISKIEEQLIYEATGKELQAGIESYYSFGWFVTLDRLCGGNPLVYEEMGRLPYSVIFAKLKLNKLDDQFSKRINKSYDNNL